MEQDENLLFQSELHPLVSESPRTRGEFVLSLAHTRAYERAREFAPGAAVLDLGCNDGYGTLMLAERALTAVGVDVSQSAIEAARKMRRRDNVDFKLIDGRVLPFPDASFDLVTSFQVIEHVVSVRPYLEEIRRVLKPEGRVFFTTPNRNIRLDPGMKPWNSFHVREYSGEELGATVCEVFPNTMIKGLMAAKPLYDIEFVRCQSALAVARRQVTEPLSNERRMAQGKPGFSGLIKAVLPLAAVARLRRVRRAWETARMPEGDRPLDEDFAARWSISDFYYVAEQSQIDLSLDLMAECQKS